MADRYHFVRAAFGEATLNLLRTSRVLVVGAGGIGCELLKTLVLTGFEDVEILDLDTIDASNLNRQFLFTKADVGKPKAVVARDTASGFNPNANIKAYHANIKDPEFGRAFFERFDLVINALDNLDARKHVNRVCIAADKPLIESGTRGFEGQVQPIRKGVTECFDCRPRQELRQYAYCTIRAMPTRMVHCVAYAKVLYEHLFGNPEDDDDPANYAALRAESLAAKETPAQLAQRLFDKVHHSAIVELLQCKDATWTTTPPTPMPRFSELPLQDPKELSALSAETILSPQQNAHCFVHSFVPLFARERTSFDKDDSTAVDFVSAVSNLRAHIYGIPMESKFQVKAIAGNIVPAIATTNAIVSGDVVLDAIRILQGKFAECRMTFCNPIPRRFQRKPCLLYPSDLLPPNPSCYICAPSRERNLTVSIDLFKATLGFLVQQVFQKELSLADPSLDIKALGCVYDPEVHSSSHPKLQKTLRELGLAEHPTGVVFDSSQELEFTLFLKHKDCADVTEFSVEGNFAATPATQVASAASQPAKSSSAAVAVGDDDEPVTYVPAKVQRKRKMAHQGDSGRGGASAIALD
eukprot:RCo046364